MIPLHALKTREGAVYLVSALGVLLIALLLLVSTGQRAWKEACYREAVLAFHQERGDRGSLLQALKRDYPGDPRVLVLLGSHELDLAKDDPERLQAAERLFEQARAIDPPMTAAVMGLTITRLRMADQKPREARVADVKAALPLLDDARDGDLPDVRYLRGAVALLAGDLGEAARLLAEPAADDLVPTREGLSALYWNRGALAMLAREGSAFQDMMKGYLLRPRPIPEPEQGMASDVDDESGEGGPAAAGGATPPPARDLARDPSRLLALSYRLALADPQARPTEPEALQARVALAVRALDLRWSGDRRGGRFLPEGELAGTLNALGIGLYRLERYAEAAERFAQAYKSVRPPEPLYLLNQAQALLRAAEQEPEGPGRKERLEAAAKAFAALAAAVKGQAGREATRAMAATNAAAIYLRCGEASAAMRAFREHGEAVGNEALRARRLGALYDHAGDAKQASKQYQAAIDAQHPEAAAMRERLRAQGSR